MFVKPNSFHCAVPRFTSLTAISIALLAGAAIHSAQAQTLTQPGAAEAEQRRIDERERLQREQLQPRPDVRLPDSSGTVLPTTEPNATPTDTGRLPKGETPCFPINRIALRIQDGQAQSGSSGFNNAPDFNWALASAHQDAAGKADSPIGVCLGAIGVNTVMSRLQNAIIAKGYTTTRVLAPPQNLKAGDLEFIVIPGRIGQIVPHAGNSAFDNSRLSWRSALSLRPGDLLNLRAVEQGLENFKRCPSCEADIQIQPSKLDGAGPGLSDLVIQYKQAFPFRVNLSLDDSGSAGTGKYLNATTVSYDNALGLNDLFYVTLNQEIGGFISQKNGGKDPGARGTKTYNAHYSVPYGNWLLGFNASKTNYHQSVAGAFTNYVYTGESKGQDVELSRLLYRDATLKSYLKLKGWAKQSRNFIDGTEIEVQRRRTAGWEATLDLKQSIGQAKLDAALTWRQGTGAKEALLAPEEAFGEGSSKPKIISATVNLSSPFNLAGFKFKASSNWRGQWNRTPLIPQDRFSLGGRGTVRGYDGQMILSTERGWLTRNELGVELGASKQEFFVAYDYGRVGGDNAQWMVTPSLQSFAVGLRGSGEPLVPYLGKPLKSLSYDAFVGWPYKKHEDFRSANKAYGFNLNWSF